MSFIYNRVNPYDFERAFATVGRTDSFSYEGKRALYEHLMDRAKDSGEPISLDPIELCGEFTEFWPAEYVEGGRCEWEDVGVDPDNAPGAEAVRDAVVRWINDHKAYAFPVDVDVHSTRPTAYKLICIAH